MYVLKKKKRDKKEQFFLSKLHCMSYHAHEPPLLFFFRYSEKKIAFIR